MIIDHVAMRERISEPTDEKKELEDYEKEKDWFEQCKVSLRTWERTQAAVNPKVEHKLPQWVQL